MTIVIEKLAILDQVVPPACRSKFFQNFILADEIALLFRLAVFSSPENSTLINILTGRENHWF